MAGMLGFSGLGVSVFALISVIVSVALDYWVYYSKNSFEVYYGLWKGCLSQPVLGTAVKVCESIEAPTTALKVVRAMLILALLLDVGAIACIVLKLFMMKDNKMVGYAASGLLLVAGLFLIVGFGVYVAEPFDDLKALNKDITLHAGFAFCIIAWLASWLGAALIGIAMTKEQD